MAKLIYVKSKPVTIESILGSPRAVVVVGGRMIEQPICQAPDDGAGIPVWAAVVDDETHTMIATEPEFLGVGLDEVKAKDPDVFDLITVQEVDDGKGGKKVVGMGAKRKGAETVLSVRAAHTFAGFDPMTGEKS